jgi:hypothetical protein
MARKKWMPQLAESAIPEFQAYGRNIAAATDDPRARETAGRIEAMRDALKRV